MGLHFFPKSARLLKRSQFQQLRSKGKRRQGDLLNFTYLERNSNKLGLTVPKKFGHAVERNRLKRLVREAYRTIAPSSPKKIHLNVHPKPQAKGCTLEQIRSDLQMIFEPKEPR